MTSRVLYSYSGIVEHVGIAELIEGISVVLNKNNITQHYHRKIIRIAIEALQNQARHGKWPTCTISDDPSSFILYEHDDSYTITTRNLINSRDIPNLAEKLQSINAASESEISDRIRIQLRDNSCIHTKGARLGLLDMKRKSGTKFTFTYKESTPFQSFFQLTITLPRSDQH